MKKWYKYSDEDKIKNVYTKYSLEMFWNWWNDNNQRVMEVRIQGYELIKETADRFNLPYSSSGVYVWTYKQLLKVIGFTREKTTIWFGIQPRMKNINKKGWKVWGSGEKGGSSDYNVSELAYLFIDIDRKIKNGVATENDLMFCDKFAERILEILGDKGWNKSYCKICTGHGIQLTIKLDIPFRMPIVKFEKLGDSYMPEINDEFNKSKLLFSTGIGKQIEKFSKEYKDLNVELDMSCFTVSRVGALPITKNYKYNTFKWRGIIELKEGINDGLSDYILEFSSADKEVKKRKTIFGKSRALIPQYHIRRGKIEKNPLCKFMLENKFPAGYINNTLWLQLKVLLRDSKIDLQGKEFRAFHEKLKRQHNRTFTLNMPAKNFTFNPNVVNNYCIENMYPPVFELWPEKNKRVNYDLIFDWNEVEYGTDENRVILKQEETLYDNMLTCKAKLIEGEIALNRIIFISFCKKCVELYGEEKTKYLIEYVFPEFFTRE